MTLCAGLISGTSMDAIDAALVDFAPHPPRLLAYRQEPFPPTLAGRLQALHASGYQASPRTVATLDAELGEAFGVAVLHLLEGAGVDAGAVAAVGSHGQTIAHDPGGTVPHTVQIGDPNRIAARCGITTVADFRRMDVALGGQGAPLASGFHAHCLRRRDHARAVLNLGGIANLTLLPADPARPALGFDCGPANAVLDDWAQRHLGARYDADGAWAASGTVDAGLLAHLLEEPFFAHAPPKSTGRDLFNLPWLERALARWPAAEPADVQATLAELTCRAVAHALAGAEFDPADLLVCGGGAHNAHLMRRLQALLGRCRVASTAVEGLDPDAVEATAFAWLAWRRLQGRSGNLPAVTGARRPAVLGAIYAAGSGVG